MREQLNYMYGLMYRIRRNERIATLEESYNTIQVEVLRHKVARRERRERERKLAFDFNDN